MATSGAFNHKSESPSPTTAITGMEGGGDTHMLCKYNIRILDQSPHIIHMHNSHGGLEADP